MRLILALSLLVVLVAGCGSRDHSGDFRKAASLDELAVTIRDHPRSYFLSDKRGGFLLGSDGQGADARLEWTVNGQTVLRNVGALAVDGKKLDPDGIDSVRVTPLEVIRFYRDGVMATTVPLDQVSGDRPSYAIAVEVRSTSPRDITVGLQPGAEFLPGSQHDPQGVLFKKGPDASLALYAGESGESGPNGITIKKATRARFTLAFAPGDSANVFARSAYGQADMLRLSRRDRMEKLLQRAYLRTSDQELTRALRWLQLSLDGLIVESSVTAAAASLPWDGSLSGGENAMALAGLDVAMGDYGTTARILRTIAPLDKHANGEAWFVRELYEHIVASGDTGLVRELYPVIQTKLASTASRHADRFNLYRADNPASSTMRSADQQALWYFHQAIGSIFAMFAGDTAHAGQWAQQADRTSAAFNQMFVDTSRKVICDQIALNGRGSMEVGPGVLLCLDMIESEVVRQNTVKQVMKALLRPHGIATRATPEAAADTSGAIRNWMAGQMVYALTRYDCQHISYPVTRRLANRILTTDMVGLLPEMYAANEQARALGAEASLAASAEFVRSFYQDYLGAHVNVTTRSLALEPKLPDDMAEVDFTIFSGAHPVDIRYERTPEKDRLVLKGEGLEDTLRVTFLWMMKNGSAWRGATSVQPGRTTTLVFGEREATAFFDGKEAMLESMRHLVGFSQRAEMEKGL
jgi:hypothetical protein